MFLNHHFGKKLYLCLLLLWSFKKEKNTKTHFLPENNEFKMYLLQQINYYHQNYFNLNYIAKSFMQVQELFYFIFFGNLTLFFFPFNHQRSDWFYIYVLYFKFSIRNVIDLWNSLEYIFHQMQKQHLYKTQNFH